MRAGRWGALFVVAAAAVALTVLAGAAGEEARASASAVRAGGDTTTAKPKPRVCRKVVKVVRGKRRQVRVCRPAPKPKPKPKPSPAQARNVSLGLEDARAGVATVGTAGGSVSATAAGGARVALVIPPEALTEDTAIRVTPVASLGGVPAGVRVLGAVQLAPDGLALAKPATLTIELPTAPAAATGFAWFGTGADVHRYPLQRTGATLSIRITHFSGAGAFSGPNTWLPAAETALKLRFGREVRPLMRAAETDDTQLGRALDASFGWLREVELLGLGDRFATWRSEILAWVPRALANAIDKAWSKCVAHDLSQLARLLELERFAQLLGIEVPGDSGWERYLKCARFELDFSTVHSLGAADGDPRWQYSLSVTGLVIQHGEGLRLSGEKALDTYSITCSCGPLAEYTGLAPFQVVDLQLGLARRPDGTSGPLDVTLWILPGNVVGWFTAQGTRVPSLASMVSFVGFFHADEIDNAVGGIVIRGWEHPGGAVLARKTYARTVTGSLGSWPEQTTFTLRHVPAS